MPVLFGPCAGHASVFGSFELQAVVHIRISRASRTLSLEDRVCCSKALYIDVLCSTNGGKGQLTPHTFYKYSEYVSVSTLCRYTV
jgi:hypothetical protein